MKTWNSLIVLQRKSLARGLCFNDEGKFNKLSVRLEVSTSTCGLEANVAVLGFGVAAALRGVSLNDDVIDDLDDDFGVWSLRNGDGE